MPIVQKYIYEGTASYEPGAQAAICTRPRGTICLGQQERSGRSRTLARL